jgi:hypothetical protein
VHACGRECGDKNTNLKLTIKVKLDYNKLGYKKTYNELPVVAKKLFQFFHSQIHVYYIIQPSYNELAAIPGIARDILHYKHTSLT